MVLFGFESNFNDIIDELYYYYDRGHRVEHIGNVVTEESWYEKNINIEDSELIKKKNNIYYYTSYDFICLIKGTLYKFRVLSR